MPSSGQDTVDAPGLDADDLAAIHQLLALYAHVVDGIVSGRPALPRGLEDVFTPDAVLDVTGSAGGALHEGLDAIRSFLGSGRWPHPPSHHGGNVVAFRQDGVVRAISKWFAVDPPTGGLRCGDYLDVLATTDAGWRIRERVAVRRWPIDTPPA